MGGYMELARPVEPREGLDGIPEAGDVLGEGVAVILEGGKDFA